MDPLAVKIIKDMIVGVPATLVRLIRSNALLEINSKLNTIMAKQDEQILSNLKSAYTAIEDAIQTPNKQTKKQRLLFAENALLPNTQLNPSLSTADRPNGHWIAIANYGLGFVCHLRGDDITAAKHFVRMFESDQQLARTKLAPKLYKDYFLPKYKEYIKYDKKSTNENVYQIIDEVTKTAAKSFVSRVIDFFDGKIEPAETGLDKRLEFAEDVQSKIDQYCKSVAQSS